MGTASPRIAMFALAALGLCPFPAFAAPDVTAEGWTLPKADGEKWANRIRKILPEKGWTLTLRGNDLVIQRNQAVEFVHHPAPNAPPDIGEKEADKHLFKDTYRITLRIGKRISYDEYETRVAENEASSRKLDELRKTVHNIHHKFDDYLASTPDEKARLKKFREEEKKLVWHELPGLYSTDHSIRLYQSWTWDVYVHDKAARGECDEVTQAVLRFFGVYDARHSRDGSAPWNIEAKR